MTPDRIDFTQEYSDGSGVQYAVRMLTVDGECRIEFESDSSSVQFPVDELPWLIEALQAITKD